MRQIIKGEQRNIGVNIRRRQPEDFTISPSTWKVFGRSGEVVDSGSCSINLHEVFATVDTTKTSYSKNNVYYIEFTMPLAGLGKVLKHRTEFRLI